MEKIMKKLTFGLPCAAAFLAVGCATGESTAEGSKPDATTETQSATTGDAQTVAMTKCAGCSKEFQTAELKMDHGKLTCEACIASHGH